MDLLGECGLPIIFQILDTEARRAQRVEMQLLSSMKTHGIAGRVHLVFEQLEFSRRSLKNLPALALNGVTLFQGRQLTEDLLNDVCLRLAKAQKKNKRWRYRGQGVNRLKLYRMSRK